MGAGLQGSTGLYLIRILPQEALSQWLCSCYKKPIPNLYSQSGVIWKCEHQIITCRSCPPTWDPPTQSWHNLVVEVKFKQNSVPVSEGGYNATTHKSNPLRALAGKEGSPSRARSRTMNSLKFMYLGAMHPSKVEIRNG